MDAYAALMPEPKHILVVDDDQALRDLIRELLEPLGYEVWAASSVDQAIAIVRVRGPDLIVTDLVMPGREGMELILELRRALCTVPIVAISGGGRGNGRLYLDMASHLGASATIYKPYLAEQLGPVITELLPQNEVATH